MCVIENEAEQLSLYRFGDGLPYLDTDKGSAPELGLSGHHKRQGCIDETKKDTRRFAGVRPGGVDLPRMGPMEFPSVGIEPRILELGVGSVMEHPTAGPVQALSRPRSTC